MNQHEKYMQRCFELAQKGLGWTSPNPVVGAVLVHRDRIIGEGFHRKAGFAHAEINALDDVRAEDRNLIPKSTLYVSLEPCNHFDKTPPCADRILKEGIPAVVISAEDPNPAVSGQSIDKLRGEGVEVRSGVLEESGRHLIRAFETSMRHERPFIRLKYALSRDGYMGKENEQYWLSASYMNPLVHRWRHEADAILVGRKTAEIDDPSLTNRNYFGTSPLRLVIDRELTIPSTHQLYSDEVPTVFFNEKNSKSRGPLTFKKLDFSRDIIPRIMAYLQERSIRSVLVEGGARTLRSFLGKNYWDEAFLLEANKYMGSGTPAPIPPVKPHRCVQIGTERIRLYRNISP